MQMGAIDYLEKPVTPSDLVRFVEAHIARADFNIKETMA
jgi:DNA-binding response OmpR family regulator